MGTCSMGDATRWRGSWTRCWAGSRLGPRPGTHEGRRWKHDGPTDTKIWRPEVRGAPHDAEQATVPLSPYRLEDPALSGGSGRVVGLRHLLGGLPSAARASVGSGRPPGPTPWPRHPPRPRLSH